ncbi:hypothetical protein, partial [Neisseria meningitidis]|uniref:hypothetical protein n=1 Tax=Neisseria meningitidis TaxID=487 RepID=UPI001C56F7AC
LYSYFEFEAATVALMNELFEKVDTIEKAMEATEDDAASLETMEATLDSFESNYDSTDLVYNTLKPLIETVSQDAQSVCQCEEDGWCSSFQL